MTQRTIDEIKQSMLDRQPAKFAELSTSNTAEWGLWVDVVAYAIWLFEGVLVLFKQGIEALLSTKKPGSLSWLAEKAYEFQYGYDLEVDENGILRYPITDESAKIIKRVSASESNGVVSLKVAAKDSEGDLVPLSTDTGELLSFQRYIDNIKYAGTKIDIVSLAADIIKYNVDLYFNPVYQESTVLDNIIEKLEEYRVNLNFNGIVYRTDFLNSILSAAGVVSAKINLMEGTQGGNTATIDVKYLLVSGYFNYDDGSEFLFINNNE